MGREPHVEVAVIGAGFGGLAMAIQLRRRGCADFVVFDRGDDVGGTWRDNTYPGCACDVPSLLYSFSFAPYADWAQAFSRQPAILDYLRRCVDRFGLRPWLRLRTEVLAAAWDDAARCWRIETSAGTWTADALVAAAGPLAEPNLPALPGLDRFAGTTFHSARWRHDHDLTGRRVAVVGTGASAVQFVPEIADRVRSLTVFQRTPPWVLPRRDRALRPAEHGLYRRLPLAQRAARAGIYWGREALVLGMRHPRLQRWQQRVAERHLKHRVPDPALRARLTPDYTLGCKRILLSNDYLPALCRDNVGVVTDPIVAVEPDGVRTADGTTHRTDTLIFGTGFHVTDLPVAERIRGRNGRTLAEVWAGSPRAYLGVTIAGFPNLFLLLGPNTGLGHTSVVFMIEAQVEHVLRALRHLRRTGAVALEPTAAAQAAFVAEVDRAAAGTVWTAGRCASWYLDRTGRLAALWPGFTWPYRRRLRRFDPAAYTLTMPAPRRTPAAA